MIECFVLACDVFLEGDGEITPTLGQIGRINTSTRQPLLI